MTLTESSSVVANDTQRPVRKSVDTVNCFIVIWARLHFKICLKLCFFVKVLDKNEIYQRIELKSRLEKWGHLSSYYVYSYSSFFVFSANHSKKLATV